MLLLVAAAGLYVSLTAAAEPDHSRVPGVVIDHLPAASRQYIGSPSIAILPDGAYVAAHDIFGPGSTFSRTVLLASTDRGHSWQRRAVIEGAFWSTLFMHRDALYLMGASKQFGNTVIRRSDDGGRTWTEPQDGNSGLLLDDGQLGLASVRVMELQAGQRFPAAQPHALRARHRGDEDRPVAPGRNANRGRHAAIRLGVPPVPQRRRNLFPHIVPIAISQGIVCERGDLKPVAGDGDLDLVVSCNDVPYNGIWLFENPGGGDKLPVFKPAVRVGPGFANISPSYADGQVRVLVPGQELTNFRQSLFAERQPVYPQAQIHPGKLRANQWKVVDYDGDGPMDIVVGVGDWTEYGWDDAFNAEGKWTNGPLHGYVYLIRNRGTSGEPEYDEPVQVVADGQPVDVFGMPSPNFADFDGDGDLDLLCGEFIDGFTYFENIGTRTAPKYAAGRKLLLDGQSLTMDLCMIVPVAIDWDGDGDVDLIVGQEDGRVALLEHTGRFADGLPLFAAPQFFQQQADWVKFGALATPFGFDWNAAGVRDSPVGGAGTAPGRRRNAANHGRIQRLDPGALRSQVGLYDAERSRLGPRRPAGPGGEFDLGSGRLVSQRGDAETSAAGRRAAGRGPVARHAAQAGLELVGSAG
jgi:hypothetical protein